MRSFSYVAFISYFFQGTPENFKVSSVQETSRHLSFLATCHFLFNLIAVGSACKKFKKELGGLSHELTGKPYKNVVLPFKKI